jgi:acetyltransferase-like isoleucine patch superfamily enzyme
MSNIKSIFRNPFTLYLQFALEAVRNRRKYEDFRQGYMSRIVHSEFEPHVRIAAGAAISNCRMGSFSYVGENTKIARADVGRFCSIGPDCRIGLGIHPARGFVSTSPVFYSTAKQCGCTFVNHDHFEESRPILIGNDVWIGASVIIGDGVSIGDGAIIGAGALVVSNVPRYSVFGGVPARLIRPRFLENEIAWLADFKWWNRGEDWIRQNHDLFLDVSRFIHRFDTVQGADQTMNLNSNSLSCQDLIRS